MDCNPVSLRPEDGPPELAFPKQPSSGRPPLFFFHEESGGDDCISVRFSNGGYSYRVFSGSKSGAGVEVANANGRRITTIECAERPQIFVEYLRLSLPCDNKPARGRSISGDGYAELFGELKDLLRRT